MQSFNAIGWRSTKRVRRRYRFVSRPGTRAAKVRHRPPEYRDDVISETFRTESTNARIVYRRSSVILRSTCIFVNIKFPRTHAGGSSRQSNVSNFGEVFRARVSVFKVQRIRRLYRPRASECLPRCTLAYRKHLRYAIIFINNDRAHVSRPYKTPRTIVRLRLFTRETNCVLVPPLPV